MFRSVQFVFLCNPVAYTTTNPLLQARKERAVTPVYLSASLSSPSPPQTCESCSYCCVLCTPGALEECKTQRETSVQVHVEDSGQNRNYKKRMSGMNVQPARLPSWVWDRTSSISRCGWRSGCGEHELVGSLSFYFETFGKLVSNFVCPVGPFSLSFLWRLSFRKEYMHQTSNCQNTPNAKPGA